MFLAKENCMIDEKMIRKAVELLKPDEGIFEVRIIKGFEIMSGYFCDPSRLIENLRKQDLKQTNIYITLHELHEGCFARLQWNQFMNASRLKIPTTSDNDVTRYKFIPIDLDPVRPAGISSSEEELKYADELRLEIIDYMDDQDFTDYICGFSGNGYHLLYRVDLPNNASSEKLIKGYLNRLDDVFSNDHCHVDITNYNPSRIFKLYGTLAQKGRHTENRPHRMSEILFTSEKYRG